MTLTHVVLSSTLAYVVYAIIWRLYLSPIAKIPGPKLAALTSWYEFYYDIIIGGQFVWHIQDLHTQYGPIIRITPWEIHVNDPAFLDEIYPSASREREKYAFFMRTLKTSEASGVTIKHDLHRRRREALNPFFSKRAISDFESIISGKISKLHDLIKRHLAAETTVNLSDAYFALSNDVVKYYCFGHDDDLLNDESKASTKRNDLTELLLGVKFTLHLPWIFDILDMLPFSIAKHIMPPAALDMANWTASTKQEIQDILNDTENVEKGSKRSIFYDLRDNPSLPPTEKSVNRLENEGTLLVMAGTESTAKSIVITHFYMLHHPDIMTRVREELKTVSKAATWSKLEQLPYLSGCIAEGNRLSFGVAARTARIAPKETLHYKGYSIPPGTPLSSTTLCIHTNETIFPDPWQFKPERWLGKEGMERRKYQMAFNKGGRSCVGMHLAYAEMFLVIAAMAGYDMELFETGVEDVEFRHEYHVAFPKLGSKGVRAVVKGICA